MEQWQQIIAVEASSLAKALPYSLMQIVCESVESCELSDWPGSRQRVISGIAHANYRSLVCSFLDCWKTQAADVSSEAVATALRTAAYSEKVHQDHQAVELVWTGPDVGVVPFRRTEQALLQVIDGAKERVLVVSYAVYKIPRICDSLIRAAARGVKSRSWLKRRIVWRGRTRTARSRPSVPRLPPSLASITGRSTIERRMQMERRAYSTSSALSPMEEHYSSRALTSPNTPSP